MALSASTKLEVRTGGSDNNGGGYVSGGIDYSTQDAAQLTLADGATSGTGVTTLTSVTGGFTSDMVGNIIHLYTGTNLTDGWYQVTAYTDTNTVTLDRSPDDGVGGVSAADLKVGGALATPGGFGKILADHGVAGWICHIKSGAYSLANSAVNTSGGPLYLNNSLTCWIEGYETTRGDRGTKPVLDAGSETNINLFSSSTASSFNPHYFVNIKADGKDGTGNVGFHTSAGTRTTCISCESVDCPVGFSEVRAYYCKATSCGTYGFNANSGGNRFSGCVADACGSGFYVTEAVVINSLAFDCTYLGFRNYYRSCFMQCTAYANGSGGFSAGTTASSMCEMINCVAVKNTGGYGLYGYGNTVIENCAGYGNSSGNNNSAGHIYNFHDLTGDPFDGAASDDYRPNNTAGEGAVLRGTGAGVYDQTDNQDIGAVQHADPASSGGGKSLIFG